jgi:hypothetical protein
LAALAQADAAGLEQTTALEPSPALQEMQQLPMVPQKIGFFAQIAGFLGIMK